MVGPEEAEIVDMKLEVVVVPVSDVDRAIAFYGGLGWRQDADLATSDDFRVVQFTPPGSNCSVIFGTGVTSATPGSTQGLQLVVSDIDEARAALATQCEEDAQAARLRNEEATARSSRSPIPTATSGSCRR